MPDSLWRDASALAAKGAPKAAFKGPDASQADAAQDIKAAVSQSLEAEGAAGDTDPVVPDSMLMDEATRTEVMRRSRIIAQVWKY